MTVMEFFGCSMIAFGPPFALFYYTVAPNAVKLLLLMTSAFFWLVSLLLSSAFWIVLPPFPGALIVSVVASVLLQELMRFLLYIVFTKAEEGLKQITNSAETALVDNKNVLAYVSGLGFGIMSGAFAILNILADAVGPGTVGLRREGESQWFFVTSAVLTLCFILLHTSWNVTFFYAVDRRNYFLIGLVIIAHLTSSLLTFLNKSHLYWASIIPNYVVLVISIWLAFRVAGGVLGKGRRRGEVVIVRRSSEEVVDGEGIST